MNVRFRTIVTAISTPFWVVVYLNIETLAQDNGWDGFLTDHWPNMSEFATQPWVFALAAVVIGAVLGAWGNHFSTARGETKPSTSSLYLTAQRSRETLEYFIRMPHGTARPRVRVDNPELQAEDLAQVRSALVSLKLWGLPVPDATTVDVEKARMLKDYFSTIMPFVAARQKPDAKAEAKKFLQRNKANTNSG